MNNLPNEFVFKANKYQETDNKGITREANTDVVISVRKTNDDNTIFKLGNTKGIDVSEEFSFYGKPTIEGDCISFIDLFSFPALICKISFTNGQPNTIYFSPSQSDFNFSNTNKSICFYGEIMNVQFCNKYVTDVKLKDGTIYTGQAFFDGISYIPNGMGYVKKEECDIHGIYKNGILEGISYRDYHGWINIGYSNLHKFEGWGLKIKNNRITFGIYEKDILRVDITMLLTEIWKEIVKLSNDYEYGIRKYDNKIFVGICDSNTQTFGFHFMNDGNVYFGISDEGLNENIVSGIFYKFDNKYNINLAEYEEKNNAIEKGSTISTYDFLFHANMLMAELHEAFDISKNYSISNYDIHKKYAYHIIEFGTLTTSKRVIIKANLLKIENEGYSYDPNEDRNTRWFAFPLKFKQYLHDIMENDEIWMPDLNDFKVDFVYVDNLGIAQQPIYCHVSFWLNDYNEEFNLYHQHKIGLIDNPFSDTVMDKPFALLNHLIPNWRNKVAGLKEQFNDSFCYDMEEYVESLCSPDFFLWLFENDQYCNRFYEELPDQFQKAFNKFKSFLLNSN